MMSRRTACAKRLCSAAAAGGGTAAAGAARLRCLASRYVRLHALDIGELQCADLPAPEQQLDVGFDAAAIHGERGCLDRAVASPKDAAGLGFRQIPAT
jgi:hypothetical protein